MRRHLFLLLLPLLCGVALTACTQSGNRGAGSLGAAGIDDAFPSTTTGSPEGTDAISASTNRSEKEAETTPQLSAYAGASFVQAPQINNYGSVTLACEIEVPPGRAGLQPGVGLSYSSSGGDGLVGIGWNLSTGLGTVSRSTRHGELYYDYRDSFVYNGSRLVKVSGPPKSENGIYRMEIESAFSRLELTDAESGGIWRLYDKFGAVTTFGETRASRVYRPDDVTKTYLWQFNKTVDLNGNTMTAEFDDASYEANHILYLREIRYTGNEAAGFAANQYVRFHFKKRDEAYVSTAAGFIMRMDRLVDFIEVGWDDPAGIFGDNTELWRYTMVYENSADSNRPLLKTVDSTRTTTRPEFIYQPANHFFVWQMAANPDSNDPEENPEATQYFEGDFNGDGLSDMVFFNPETGDWRAAEAMPGGGYAFKIYGNRFQGYDGPEKIQWFKGNVSGDYNGDGRSDIAFYLPGTKEFWVAEHDGRVFRFRRYGRLARTTIDIFKCEWFPGDYDGNGLSDSVLFNEPTGEWILMRNLGGRFEFISFSRKLRHIFRNDYAPNANLDSLATFDDTEFGRDREKVHFLNGDYNGDGRADISVYDARSGRWLVAENYRDDLIGFRLRWKLYKVFTAPEQTLFGHDRFSGDYNGDGFSDFLLFNRETNEWIIGETLEGTIRFRIFGKLPAHKEITRWLQGDFNGDGRTDIGFFSATDNNFWVGEATPTGFRYRIYNNLSYGPDPERVLRTPYPEDEVVLQERSAAVALQGSTAIATYRFDASYYAERGEEVFAGNFSGDASAPEFLIRRRRDRTFHFKQGTGEPVLQSGLNGIDLDAENVSVLNHRSVVPFMTGSLQRDSLLYDERLSTDTGALHLFHAISRDSGGFRDDLFATVSPEVVSGFDPAELFYLIDDFDGQGGTHKKLLVFDYRREGEAPDFVYWNGPGEGDAVRIAIDPLCDFAVQGLPYVSENPERFRLFSGRFTAGPDEPAQVLLVDMREEGHAWFLGTLDLAMLPEPVISFTRVSSECEFIPDGYSGEYRVLPDAAGGASILFARTGGAGEVFQKLRIEQHVAETTLAQVAGYAVDDDTLLFRGEFDHRGNPLLFGASGFERVNLSGPRPGLEPVTPGKTPGYTAFHIERPDLMELVSVYRWIQGDYNGDGKTDIGIFHLKERQWYFANTGGTVPDLVYRVKNGIGGIYEMTYENSSHFDNTGDDDIPDMPMNYKVCTRLTVDDGLGGRITTDYVYKDGFAFSAFINGEKETDYFGFSEFQVIDATGSKTTNYYYTVPYDDFRKNRALAGMMRESFFLGSDCKEYNRTKYEHALYEITPPGFEKAVSFFVEPVKIEKYMNGVLMQTTASHSVLTPGKYEMVARSESVTDHYDDGVHDPVTVTGYSEYSNNETTNEMRLAVKKSFNGTVYERTTFYEYDTHGNLVARTLRYTGSGLPPAADRVMRYAYDVYGNRIRETDASGSPTRVTEMSYDDRLHQYVVEGSSLGTTMTLVNRYGVNYGSAFGGVEKKTDPNGASTYYEFDQYGRLERQYGDTDEGKVLFCRYLYTTGYPLSVKAIQYTGNGSDSETRVFVDGMGRDIHTVRSAMGVSGKRYVKTGMVVYDAVGRVVRKSQTDWAPDDEIDLFRINEREKNPTVTEYDASGRPTRMLLPAAYAGEAETAFGFTYHDPWETVETNSVGRVKRIVKNARGLVLYVEESGRGDDGVPAGAQIGFAYNLEGNRVKKMDLNGTAMSLAIPSHLFEPGAKDTSGHNVAVWKYNGLGKQVESNDPDLGYSVISYNGFGDMQASGDAMNRVTTYEYDRLGRLTGKVLPDGEGSMVTVYDSLAGCENALGRVVRIDDPAQVKTFSYDRLGRVKHEVRFIKATDETFVTDFRYDLLARMTRIEYPVDPVTNARLAVAYEQGPMGVVRITSTAEGVSRDIVSGIEYNEFGQVGRIVRSNGTTTDYYYDRKGRLARLVTVTNYGGSEHKLQDVSYSFRVDNAISSVDNRPDIDTGGSFASSIRYSYRYDGLCRLVRADGIYEGLEGHKGKGGEAGKPAGVVRKFEYGYEYSANGNLLTRTLYNADSHAVEDAWSYDYSNHAVTSISSSRLGGARFNMQYDLVGNMVYQEDTEKRLRKRMAFDSANRVSTVTNPVTGDLMGEYRYDDQGFRVWKLAARAVDGKAGFIELVYPSMFFEVERKRNKKMKILPHTTIAVNNIYLQGVRIAAVTAGNRARFYHLDQVDSVKGVTDDQGKPITRMEYLPYGETWFTEGDETNRPKYNSQEFDEETSYYFYNARYYDPLISRFVTADTVIDGEYSAQGWNRFMYCQGNPIRYKDPTGHYLFIEQTNPQFFRKTMSHLRRISPAVRVDRITGEVSIDKNVDIKHYKKGTELLERLCASDKVVMIHYTKGGNEDWYKKEGRYRKFGVIRLRQGKGTDPDVYYNPDLTPQTRYNPKIPTIDKTTGKLKMAYRHDLLGLSHELIHASHNVEGTADTRKELQKYTINGVTERDWVQKEELRTVGLKYVSATDITENDIRREQGVELRGAY